jgi:transketolase
MTIAEEHLRAVHGKDLTDHFTYLFCGDGDLMEGVSSEAASLAGHLELGRLIVFYDDNSITIDGSTELAFSENVPERFDAYGWQTITVDGHDREAIAEAIDMARADTGRPTLISAKTHIGFGAPTKQDTSSSHGSPLGDVEIAGFKESIGWELPEFAAPDAVYELFANAMQRGIDARASWAGRYRDITRDDPDRAQIWSSGWSPEPVHLEAPDLEAGSSIATRKLSELVIQQLAAKRPDVMSGSADLAPSNNTLIADSTDFSATDRTGRNMRYGIREHAMGAALNGMALHGGVRPFGGTFLVFSDYMRPSVRLAALMGVPAIYVWTHDSVFLGEDGPTHQPIEHLAALRVMPNLHVIRPADPTETAIGWEHAINRLDGPSALILTRQGLPVPVIPPDRDAVARGGYVRFPGDDAIVVATGSEVGLAEQASAELADAGISLRVVSMPCVECFVDQPAVYQSEVIGSGLPVFTLEAGTTDLWARFVSHGGEAIGIDRFGASAPADALAETFGFDASAVAQRVAAALQ